MVVVVVDTVGHLSVVAALAIHLGYMPMVVARELRDTTAILITALPAEVAAAAQVMRVMDIMVAVAMVADTMVATAIFMQVEAAAASVVPARAPRNNRVIMVLKAVMEHIIV